MKKQYLVKAFNGRKEKFLSLESDKKVLKENVKDAHKFVSEVDAETTIEGVYLADEIAEILGKDMIKDETMFTIIPIFVTD